MSETKDQTIARLEGELLIEKNAVAHLAQSTSGLLKRAETAEAELAATRADAYERDKAKHYEGACWMLDSIRASLRVYPNGGGDIEVMKEVDRIRLESRIQGCLECGCRECLAVIPNYQNELRAPVPTEGEK